MENINCILVKPLNGNPPGTEMEFNEVDFAFLEEKGAVKKANKAKAKEDAPKAKGK